MRIVMVVWYSALALILSSSAGYNFADLRYHHQSAAGDLFWGLLEFLVSWAVMNDIRKTWSKEKE